MDYDKNEPQTAEAIGRLQPTNIPEWLLFVWIYGEMPISGIFQKGGIVFPLSPAAQNQEHAYLPQPLR
ncbi:hypothetical protein G8C92_20405 [Paenibacillus donghaensis]|uniref:hypothetical protein n=1 Tax=Paenibacillus donghaensis TaxID=414771 RepID=UPI0018848FE1|nr:hypothetical protein [Paenibacillus donghaensis]MBE9916383.1 hypothetical protein [Paenibacillus donghaensis]